MYDAGPFNWVRPNMKYVFAMIESTSRQIFPRMNWNGNSGVTRVNVPQTSLVLDSGATIYFFGNQEFLQAIKKSDNSMTIHCGGSTFDQAMIGRLHDELKHLLLPNGELCVAKDGIANLLSMGKLVKEGYRVHIDSDVENAINVFNVFNEDGSYIKFVCVNDGLYCINLDDNGGHVNYLTTASEQKDHFSDVDNKKADLARYIQECLCLPSDKHFAEAIDTGGIKECGIDRNC